jgi:succinate dehydrogenase / fumarate reductase cytochrome b subunit
MANKNKIDTIKRPMSPHLQVYKISFTMIMSMMHRISGFVLYLGSFLFLAWYLSIFFGQESYNFVNQLFSFSIIKFALFLFTWVFFHHLFGGIRHFIWDFGLGFDLNSIEWLARLTALFSFLSASLLWLL